MKQLKILIATLICTILFSCYSVKYNPPKLVSETFTYLTTHAVVEVCGRTKKHGFQCLKLDPMYFRASGSVIKHIKENSYVLTVAHFCDINREKVIEAAIDPIAMRSIFKNVKDINVKINIKVLDGTGATKRAKIIDSNSLLDVCILETDRIDTKVLKLAATPPTYGDTMWNLASPLGITIPGSVPILKGIYSGKVNLNAGRKVYVVTDLPAIFGCSGSPLINHYGKLVGMVYSTNLHFKEISYAVTLEDIRKYLDEIFITSSKPPPITGNTTVEVEIDPI